MSSFNEKLQNLYFIFSACAYRGGGMKIKKKFNVISHISHDIQKVL